MSVQLSRSVNFSVKLEKRKADTQVFSKCSIMMYKPELSLNDVKQVIK